MDRETKIDLMLDRMRSGWTADGNSIQAERDAFVVLSRRFPKPTGVKEHCGESGGVPVIETTPEGFDQDSDPTMLYLHGGAFLIGSAEIYQHQSSRIARAAGARIVSVDYRLAPEHPFPAAVDDVVVAYTGLLDNGTNPSQIVIAGDSAGGNLALAAAMRLRDEGRPLPAGLVLLSPWVDLTCSNPSMKVNADDRHLAQQQGLLFSATTYLNGADPRSPLASPLYGDLYDLPPTLIQVGALETLLGESLDLERALSSAGTNVQVHVYDGMVHEWHLLSALLEAEGGLGDADEAIAEIAAFTSSVCST